jgi:hypothetical protein
LAPPPQTPEDVKSGFGGIDFGSVAFTVRGVVCAPASEAELREPVPTARAAMAATDKDLAIFASTRSRFIPFCFDPQFCGLK